MSISEVIPNGYIVGEQIGTRSFPRCPVCGCEGELLYAKQTDRLFDAPGEWDFKLCPKPACGLVWLDPIPTEEEIGKAYKHYHTHRGERTVPNNWLYRAYAYVQRGYLAHNYGYFEGLATPFLKALGHIMYLLPVRRACLHAAVLGVPAVPGGRLLDVGCGSGQLLARMAALGWNVEGLEPDPVAAGIALKSGLNVRQGSLTSHPFASRSFDVIVMSHVIEHVHSPLAAMTACYTLLKPNGRLVIFTPNVGSLGHRIHKSNWRGLEPPRHVQIFSFSALASIAARAGFARQQLTQITRQANFIFAAGFDLWKGPARSVPRSCGSWLWANLMSRIEWTYSLIDQSAGEEIMLIATKYDES